MENPMTDTVPSRDARAYLGHDTDVRAELREPRTGQELSVLQVPVGTNLADVERWMIFATLQKCGGNKTRAAASLGVSLKTLYNRLNAYRAQGLVMDYAATAGRDQRDIEVTGLHGELTRDLTEV
jgi:DNA-binding NtrC family response regulator